MDKQNDEVYLAKGCETWPVELAEKLLASPLSWGPPTYVFGHYVDDPNQPDQFDEFLKLARCVDGAYKRHGGDMGEAWDWANPVIEHVRAGDSCAEYTTQDLLDILFLCLRGDRFSDGLIRSVEPLLRRMLQEVVRRVHSPTPPVFLAWKE